MATARKTLGKMIQVTAGKTRLAWGIMALSVPWPSPRGRAGTSCSRQIEHGRREPADESQSPDPIQPPPAHRRHRDHRTQRAPQFTAGHEDAHARADTIAGHPCRHGRGRGMEGGDADADGQQQQRQREVVGRKADHRHHRGRDARRQNHEIAQADAVGQIADEGVEQARQHGKNGQRAGHGIVGGERLLDYRQQRSQKCREGVMDEMGSRNGRHLIRVECGIDAGIGRREIDRRQMSPAPVPPALAQQIAWSWCDYPRKDSPINEIMWV